MGVLRLKPYEIARYTRTEGYMADNGDYIPGGEVLGEWEPCDAVPSGQAAERTFEDGVSRKYSLTVYMRADCKEFEIGDKVRLKRADLEDDFDVKGFHRYQHQAKLWV
jgi:hypothetical protein